MARRPHLHCKGECVVKKLKLGLPKGSLQEATFKVFKKAGFTITIGSRSYFPSIDDEEIEPVLIRAQEMSRYIEDGILDCGITGEDWITENNSQVVKVEELAYSKATLQPVRWVLAVPNDSSVKKVKDLQGARIATELVNATKKYLKKNGVSAEVEFSWGATEAKARAKLVDAIVELTETGSSLRAHELRIVDTVCFSTTQFVANKKAWADSWKKEKMENIVVLLTGAIRAEEKVGLKMNAPIRELDKILKLLPSMKRPTISNLTDSDWCAIEVIVDEKKVRTLIPLLRRAGAQGIIEYPLNKVI